MAQQGRRKQADWEKTKTEMRRYLRDAQILVLTFHRGTQRSYIFLIGDAVIRIRKKQISICKHEKGIVKPESAGPFSGLWLFVSGFYQIGIVSCSWDQSGIPDHLYGFIIPKCDQFQIVKQLRITGAVVRPLQIGCKPSIRRTIIFCEIPVNPDPDAPSRQKAQQSVFPVITDISHILIFHICMSPFPICLKHSRWVSYLL